MKGKVLEMKNSLEEILNHYIDNDDEVSMLAIQNVCMSFFEIFGQE